MEDEDKDVEKEETNEPDITDDVDLDLGEEKSEEIEEGKEEEDEPEPKKDDEEDDPKYKELNDKLTKQATQIRNLNIALSGERAKNKESKEEKGDPPFTEAQLIALFEEHGNDPKALYQLTKYMTDQSRKKGKEEAVDAAEILSTQKEISNELYKQYPDLSDDTSEIRQGVEKVKGNLRISDHPYADLLAISAMTYNSMPDLLKAEFEKGKAEGMKAKTTEEARKSNIKNGKLTGGNGENKGKKPTMSKDALDIAKRIGLSKTGTATYMKLLGKKTEEI